MPRVVAPAGARTVAGESAQPQDVSIDASGSRPQTLSRAEVLRALTVVFSQPDVLVNALRDADSDEGAEVAIGRAFGLSAAEAGVVLDQQIRTVTRTHVDRLRDELGLGPADGATPAG